MSIRDTDYYKAFKEGCQSYHAVGIAEGFEDAESEEELLAAWQHLVDTGMAYSLQGWFGRTAESLISQGAIEGAA
jgi:hypothetical protein